VTQEWFDTRKIAYSGERCLGVDRELNKPQIEEFFDTGFTTAEQFFDDREMSEISSGFDRLLEIAEEIVRAPDFNPDDAHNIGYDGSYFDLRCMDGETKRSGYSIAESGRSAPVASLHHPRQQAQYLEPSAEDPDQRIRLSRRDPTDVRGEREGLGGVGTVTAMTQIDPHPPVCVAHYAAT
jgi:hypothetical protein